MCGLEGKKESGGQSKGGSQEKEGCGKEEEEKKTLEYLQQLQDKMLTEDTALLEGAEGSQIVRSKCKKISLEDNRNCWPFKKAKDKQPARYYGNIRVKIGRTNLCERCMCTRQNCLMYHSR